MKKEINMTIWNRLIIEKRDIVVYHHSTRSSHMISVGSTLKLPLLSVIEGDYLHIAIASGPGNLEHANVVNLPSWADFEFISNQTIAVSHSSDRILVKIPPGTSPWQLKITRLRSSTIEYPVGSITIEDLQPGNSWKKQSKYLL